jgi:hypothetical protein
LGLPPGTSRRRKLSATSESINARVQWVKIYGRGFRNKQNFINPVYFHCGGLDQTSSLSK